MTLELLKSNIEREIEITNQIILIYNQTSKITKIDNSGINTKGLLTNVASLVKQLESLNNAIPNLLEGIQFYKDLKESEGKSLDEITKIRYNSSTEEGKKVELGINKEDQDKFLEGLSKTKETEEIIEKIKKRELGGLIESGNEEESLAILSPYIRLSNKFFLNTSDSLIEKGYFDSLNRELRKISSPFILRSYVSMMLFSSALSIFLGLVVGIMLIVVMKMIVVGLVVFFVIPLVVLAFFYFYPISQRADYDKMIIQELPFVVIYMASVSTSGISPSNIFGILARTKDYPITQREIKKLLNYINFYGYDLVTALRYSAKNCPSVKLSLLFNGLATAIRSGGDLSEFLNKHAESLLFDYRLEREKYTKVAETFMDIYISILIAAPMIMMILLVLLSLTKTFSEMVTPGLLSFSIIGIISILNVGFLIFLNSKQPKF